MRISRATGVVVPDVGPLVEAKAVDKVVELVDDAVERRQPVVDEVGHVAGLEETG